jgi:hypothetical protein
MRASFVDLVAHADEGVQEIWRPDPLKSPRKRGESAFFAAN